MRWMATSVMAATLGAFSAGSYVIVAQELKSQWSGIFTVEQATRGKAMYSDKCSSCHGDDGEGTAMAPGLIDETFATAWNDQPLADVFDRIQKTMPQNAPDSLLPQETADILAFVLSQAKYPAGSQELPSNLLILKTYKFLAKNPAAQN